MRISKGNSFLQKAGGDETPLKGFFELISESPQLKVVSWGVYFTL